MLKFPSYIGPVAQLPACRQVDFNASKNNQHQAINHPHCSDLHIVNYRSTINLVAPEIKQEVIKFRRKGLTYSEIQHMLGKSIPKSTLSYWCKGIPLSINYTEKVSLLNEENLRKARGKAWSTNKERRNNYLQSIFETNRPLANLIDQKNIAKIFLSALYLGEGKKYKRDFSFGNSNPKIIKLFLKLLKDVFVFDLKKIRFTVQCRADQNTKALEEYWSHILGISQKQFYKTRIDPRTVGKPTIKKEYKGVLRVDYFDTKARLELDCLADLICQRIET